MLADFVQTGLGSWWAPALAFAAGVVAFASPCVFPLVPGYLSFVTGAHERGERLPLLPVLAFVGGFATIFTLLGAASFEIRRFLRSDVVEITAGVFMVAFGVLMLLYALRVGSPSLYAERRPFLERVRPGPVGAFPLGMAFAVGWTPCIGPVLGTVLLIASGQGGTLRGSFLLLMFSFGLGLPFVLVGLGLRRWVGALDFIKRNYHWIAGVSGAVMVAIGILVITGVWTRLIAPVFEGFVPPI
jgi:cytochrome c-type biogenesis protein